MEAYLTGMDAHILPALAILLAAFIQSITGFGLVIVAAPLLMLFYDAKLTVPIMLLLACSSNATQGFLMRRQANLLMRNHRRKNCCRCCIICPVFWIS